MIGVFESRRAVVAGDLELARKTVAKARAIEAGDSFALFGAGALSVDGCVKASTGDAREGMQLIERGAQHYGTHGVRTFLPFYMSIGAQGLATSGDLPDARRLLEKAQTTLAATGELWQQPFVMCAEARVLHASDQDRSGAAARVLGDAHAVAVAQGALGAAAYVARVAAELDLALT